MKVQYRFDKKDLEDLIRKGLSFEPGLTTAILSKCNIRFICNHKKKPPELSLVVEREEND